MVNVPAVSLKVPGKVRRVNMQERILKPPDRPVNPHELMHVLAGKVCFSFPEKPYHAVRIYSTVPEISTKKVIQSWNEKGIIFNGVCRTIGDPDSVELWGSIPMR